MFISLETFKKQDVRTSTKVIAIIGLILSFGSLSYAGFIAFTFYMFSGIAGPIGGAEMKVVFNTYFLLTLLTIVVILLMARLLQGKSVNKLILSGLFLLIVVLQLISFRTFSSGSEGLDQDQAEASLRLME